MTIEEVKELLEERTGLKITVRRERLQGSMRGYMRFRPIKTSGVYPEWSFEFGREMSAKFHVDGPNPTFCNNWSLSVYFGDHIY